MGDVEATIHLCRLISERAPEVWSSSMRFSRKAAVVDYITAEPIFCMNEIYYGRTYSYLVTSIGQDTDNLNEWNLYDLAVDPDSLIGLTQDELGARLALWPKPFRTMRSNAVPILFSADEAPDGCKGRECGRKNWKEGRVFWKRTRRCAVGLLPHTAMAKRNTRL